MNKKRKVCITIGLISFVILASSLFLVNRKDIDKALTSEAYSYLPLEAKNYIKEVYEATGKMVLTEKNKEKNKLYLNPQYVDYLTFSKEEKSNLGEIPSPMVVDYTIREEAKNITLPSNYDLRNVDEKNYLTPVRNQGNLGICWTFATAGAAESHLLKTSDTSYTESAKLISERQMDYITAKNSINDYKSEYVSFINRLLGSGGNFYISTIAMANGVSLIDYNDFKEYNDNDLQEMELSDVISYNKSQYEVNSTVIVPRNDLRESTSTLTDDEKATRNSYLNEVKQNIIENGASYVSTYVDSGCTYTDPSSNNTVIDVYNCSAASGHAMGIIGWNDDFEYSYCADTKNHSTDLSNCKKKVSGKGVWILKNSWGEDDQYPYLTYDSLYTTISFIDEMEKTTDRTWDNNYVFGDEYENINEKTYSLSNTKIKGDEKIQKVKFIAQTPDTTYNVKIHKKDGDFETFTKTTELPGLITLNISKDIIVDKNTKITINSEGGYIDKISIFTTNTDTTPYIDLDKYNNSEIFESEIRLYSETKNIASGSVLTYKLYDSKDQDVTNKATFTNNTVAENNVNTLANFSNELTSGKYRLDVYYNSNKISSININISKMQGNGTKDNPYIITNATQLSQIRDDLDGYYELGNDIDLSEDTKDGGKLSVSSTHCPNGLGWEAINGFTGTLDGKGNSIKGLYQNNYITCPSENGKWQEWSDAGNGLFASASGNVTIKNLVLEDFNITCRDGYCGALLSNYNANNGDSNDTNEYNATFENIVFKNSQMSASREKSARSYGGGMFGYVKSRNGNISFSNIFLDFEIIPEELSQTAYLAQYVDGKQVNIQDIQVIGQIDGKYKDGSETAVLVESFYIGSSVAIKNVLSTVTGSNIGGTLLNEASSNITISDVNTLKIGDKGICRSNCNNITNANLYDKNTELIELTKSSNYTSWENLNSNWLFKTVNGIPRIPILKIVNFEYTSIDDITINQKLNEHKNIYDYIKPQTKAAKNISYKSNDESIVKIDENGTIIPQATGNTTIHIESFYDGYIKDVPINIEYTPHYDIVFDANGGEGTMDNFEISTETGGTLPKNLFTKNNYEFTEWNTKADGTGTSYSDLAQVPIMNDKDSMTLYAQWIGEEKIVTFDPNGGTVNPEQKIVRFGEIYEEFPIPVREGYGFGGWCYKNNIGLLISPFIIFSTDELIANWVENAYTIIYDASGGKKDPNYNNASEVRFMSETLATSYGKNNEAKEVSSNLYEKKGNIFKEWNTKADGTGTAYTEGQEINLNNVDNSVLKLYAIWETTNGNVTYNSNDGTDTTITKSYTLNVETNLEKNTFKRDGYKFKEWNTKADGTGTSYEDEQAITVVGNLTLYAIWEESYDFTINKYSYDKNNKYIDLIEANTTLSDFKRNINLNTNYTLTVDYKTVDGKQVLYTGGKTKIFKNQTPYIELTNIVRGDVNGNGKIDIIDYIRIKKDIMDTEKLNTIYKKAADMNNNSSIDIIDYIRIKKIIMEAY